MKYVIISIIFFIPFIFANAQVIINEIQISPTDKRFIELYNSGDLDVDLTGWYIQRKIVTGNSFNSLITSSDFEGKSVKAGEYFLISRGLFADSDIVIDNLTLTEYNTLRIRNSEREDIDQIELVEIKDGESYQRMSNNEWISSPPTPKSENINFISGESGNPLSNTGEDSNQTQQTNSNIENQKSPFSIEPQIFVYAGEDREVIVGADTIFEGKSFGLKKEPLANARYLWNFGDGKTKEGKNVLYYYKYPGEYIGILNVSSGEFSASDRIIVKAFEADISISSVEDDFIEIFNKTNQELNFSLWQLLSGNDYFTIPKDTIILPNKKLIFSSDITKLDTKNKKEVSLLYPNRALAVKFDEIKVLQKNLPTGGEVEKVNIQKQIPQKTESSIKTNQTKEISDTNSVNLEKKTTDKNNQKDTVQTASAVSSISADKKDSQIYKWLFILFGIIVASVGILIHTSSKKEPGDDIEIIE